ncbi:unnamed protein product [Cylindrotheca closterium]|uniref:ATP-dependent DNA helicase n=1 Tax=Cylindrotheca closterium TaxID=2856 RepID=A0AAD2FIV0_9STRA|nr:unnamed protein product [Cylindrotheca closterium]
MEENDIVSLDHLQHNEEKHKDDGLGTSWYNDGVQSKIDHAILLNDGQAEIINTYKDYLLNPDNPGGTALPPSVALLTCKGGTGKSFVTHQLLKIGNHKTKTVWTLASNNLNAADIDGSTIASVLKQRIQQKMEEAKTVQQKISHAAVLALERQNVCNARLIIIDKISNVTASKLGQLSRLFSECTQKPNEFFGGIPVLLVGHSNQKEPVGGLLATTSLLKKIDNETKAKEDATRRKQNKAKHWKMLSNHKSASIIDANSNNVASDSTLGCKILASCRWFELTAAERSKDKEHNENVDRLYDGMPIQLDKFHMYKMYNDNTLMADSPEERLRWLKAPVIVKTNRERCAINYARALQFAKATNAILV